MVISYVLPGLDTVPYLVNLSHELVSQGSLKDIPFDWNYAVERAKRFIGDPDCYACLAKDEYDSYLGFVAGHVEPFWFSPRLHAVEDAWYVRKVTDRGKIAMALMRGFVDWAVKMKRAVHVQSGDIANIDTVAVHSAYTRLGFERYGVIYKYEGAASC